MWILEYILEFIPYPCHVCHHIWKGEIEWFSQNKFVFCSQECYCLNLI
jgi:hypothetical protein